jgi:hypothetical protein
MHNLPKPPKLYFYLAGLAIFILILGGVGFYFYQKQNTVKSETAPTPQNSLTLNPETAKTPDEANNKPKEGNLTSSSFDADPNTDVIVFKECNMVLKLKNDSDLRFYITGTKSKAILSMYAVTPPSLLHSLSCSSGKSDKAENAANFLETPVWLKKLSENYKLKLTGFTGTKTWSNDFQYNNLYYSLYSSYDDIFSSAKFGIEIPNSLKQVKVIDLEELSKMGFPTITEYQNTNPKTLKDIDLIGCSEASPYKYCFITDEDLNPLIDIEKSELKISKTSLAGYQISDTYLSKGRKTDKSRYLIATYKHICGDYINVFEFNFIKGTITEPAPNTNFNNVQCSGKEILNEPTDQERKQIENLAKIEQVKHKAAQVELAKYLE